MQLFTLLKCIPIQTEILSVREISGIKGGIGMRKKKKAESLASRLAAAIAGSIMTDFSVAGCTLQSDDAARESFKTGLIFEIMDTGVYVASEGIDSATYIAFDGVTWVDADGNTIATDALSAGQQVRYNYTSVMESWPMQLVGCSKVTVTGHTEDVSALIEEWNRTQSQLAAEENFGMPTLRIIREDGEKSVCYKPVRGSSVWNRGKGRLCQDSSLPICWQQERMVCIPSTGGKLRVAFAGAAGNPDSIQLLRWDADEKPGAVPEEETLRPGESFSPRSGSVYMLSADWKKEEIGGKLSWGFRVEA